MAAVIRRARPGDVDDLMGMVHDLADYERSPSSVEMDGGQLRDALFRSSPTVFAHVAEDGHRLVGMAIWFLTFSTWTGSTGIYLEDLYVRPEARSAGVGRALVSALASLAQRSGYRRIDWAVLDWNDTAVRFYQSLGSVPMDEWIGYRLSGETLAMLGSADRQEE
jgi:GNAT superfamily N-acetyltransferase